MDYSKVENLFLKNVQLTQEQMNIKLNQKKQFNEDGNEPDVESIQALQNDPNFIGQSLKMPFNSNHLPIANVGRLMKDSLDNKIKISKNAKECTQECVSEFISFVTCEAVERCKAEKRKTISGEDIIKSLNSLGFDMYAEILTVYLKKYKTAWKVLDDQQINEKDNDTNQQMDDKSFLNDNLSMSNI